MSAQAVQAVIRPIRESDVEALGRVHAVVWHETYDRLLSKAAFENLSPRRMAELWSHYVTRGSAYRQFAALVDGEIVGFIGSGPARDIDAPRPLELYFIYVLAKYNGTGIGRQLFEAAVGDDPVYLWAASDPGARAHKFYELNGLEADGAEHIEQFLGEDLHEVRYVR